MLFRGSFVGVFNPMTCTVESLEDHNLSRVPGVVTNGHAEKLAHLHPPCTGLMDVALR